MRVIQMHKINTKHAREYTMAFSRRLSVQRLGIACWIIVVFYIAWFTTAGRVAPAEFVIDSVTDGAAGGDVLVAGRVVNDPDSIDRSCERDMWVYSIDAVGNQKQITYTHTPAENRTRQARDGYDWLSGPYRLSIAIDPGPATLQAVVQWKCDDWVSRVSGSPIERTTSHPFVVRPPAPNLLPPASLDSGRPVGHAGRGLVRSGGFWSVIARRISGE